VWRTRALGAALVAILSLPAATYVIPDSLPGPARRPARPGGPEAGPASALGTYEGLATWVDMFDKGPWKNPARTTRRMAERGTATLYLQTSNYRKNNDIYRPRAMSRLLETAHANGMKVIAWYLPSYAHPRRDWRRTKAAVTFVSANGQFFDGFAMTSKRPWNRRSPFGISGRLLFPTDSDGTWATTTRWARSPRTP
jgi:hypothetical protein